MTDYATAAAAELDKAQAANDRKRARAVALRQDGHHVRAAELDDEAAAMSVQIAEGYIALAMLGRDAADAVPGGGDLP